MEIHTNLVYCHIAHSFYISNEWRIIWAIWIIWIIFQIFTCQRAHPGFRFLRITAYQIIESSQIWFILIISVKTTQAFRR